MCKRLMRKFLIVLLFALLLTVSANAAAADYSGSMQIINQKREGSTLSFTAALSGITPKGQLAAAVFSEIPWCSVDLSVV